MAGIAWYGLKVLYSISFKEQNCSLETWKQSSSPWIRGWYVRSSKEASLWSKKPRPVWYLDGNSVTRASSFKFHGLLPWSSITNTWILLLQDSFFFIWRHEKSCLRLKRERLRSSLCDNHLAHKDICDEIVIEAILPSWNWIGLLRHLKQTILI